MAIDFTPTRWEKIRHDYRQWWQGELKRPLIQLQVKGRDPGRPEPRLPFHHFTAFYDLDVSAEAIVDRWDYLLSGYHFLGDGFPSIWPNFGPGVVAAFMGARLQRGESTCWFFAEKDQAIDKIQLAHNPHSVWFNRIKAICQAAMTRWEGLVQVGMTDLGGNLDILYTFRQGEKLLLDLLEHPDAVKRVTWDAHRMWWYYFNEINAVLQPVNPGYTAWTPLFSDVPYYILQCDFCYMISPAMFDEFVKPELVASCQRLGNAFYHLDGKGQLPHLDSILQIETLKGVQWVPGTGQSEVTEWPAVYRKIRAAGKLIQIWGNLATLDTLARQLGSAEGIILIGEVEASEEASAREFLKKYHVS